MTTIAFFGHDAADAAVRRRVQAFRDDGLDVIGFMMRRREIGSPEWDNVDLGLTQDGAFVQRTRQIFAGARLAANAQAQLARADVIYARNLDMLACAFLAKRHARLATPVIYESLDIHRLLTRNDPVGASLRQVERALLARSAGLVVSSPGFLEHHFDKRYGPLVTPYLVENRLAAGAAYGPRGSGVREASGKLRIGWVGNLRCKRSLDLLCTLADTFPQRIEVHLHGQPARTEIQVFEPKIEARANMRFHGRYRAPEDLSAIYGGLDLVWAGDFMEAGVNSVWLLPNRIYEGGYFGVPPVAPAGTETAVWIERNACGFTLPEPLDQALPGLISELLADRRPIADRAQRLADLPENTFIQPHGFLADIVRRALASTVTG